MNRKRVKYLCLVVTIVLILGMLSGCGQTSSNGTVGTNTAGVSADVTTAQASEQEDTSPITFTALDYNGEKEWGTDEISKEITKETGVTLQYLPTGDDSNSKLLILLASGDIPDLILQGLFSTVESKYVAAGAVLQLDDLVNHYASNIKSEVGDDYLNLMRTQHDGKLYSLPSWYQNPVMKSGNGALMMRQDILSEFAPDKANGDGYFTYDEYLNVLKQVKQKYPNMVGYLPNGENIEWWVMWVFRGFEGIYNYSVQGDQVKLYYEDPMLLDAYKFLNNIMRSGLSDPGWATMRTDSFYQKVASGDVFSTTSAYWDQDTPNAALEQAGKGQMMPYKLVGSGVDPSKLTLGGTNLLGWDSIMIGKNCKDPERAIKFLDFMASQKGQKLIRFGVEGQQWDMVNGQITPKQDVIDANKAGGDSWNGFNKSIGIDTYYWMVRATAPDRYTSIVDYVSKNGTPDPVTAMANKTLSDTAYAQDIFSGLDPDANTPEDLIAQKCKDIFLQSSVGIINAKSEDECESLYNKMLKDLANAEAAKVDKVYTDKFNAKKDAYGWNP
jgi:putative aldouronate transport system substrate-binding protein